MNINVHDIVTLVSQEFGVNRIEILSVRRAAGVTAARRAVYGLARHWTSKSYPEIADALNHRNHTTVLYGVRRFEEVVRSDPDFARHVRRIENMLAYLSAMHTSNMRTVA